MNSYVEKIASLTVGTIESVAPNEFRVLLDIDAPQTTALNAVVPQGFPRLNGYVLIPNEVGSIVGIVTWLGIERSAYPRRSGFKDFGLLDLPFPLRKMTVLPLGTLQQTVDREYPDRLTYQLNRGLSVYPSVGDKVILPSVSQLRNIIEGGETELGVVIGTSVLAADAKISVHPNKIFGRHLAILGNTGSGKSCTVTGVIRWTLERAEEERTKRQSKKPLNCRFIVLDPNGEYRNTFDDLHARVFQVQGGHSKFTDIHSTRNIQVPAWLWDEQEWVAFTGARPGVQRPMLLRALRELKAGGKLDLTEVDAVRRYLSFVKQKLQFIVNDPAQYTEYTKYKDVGGLLVSVQDKCMRFQVPDEGLSRAIQEVVNQCDEIIRRRRNDKGYWSSFVESELLELVNRTNTVIAQCGESVEQTPEVDANSPIPFNVHALADYLDDMTLHESPGNVQHIQTLSARIRALLKDAKLGAIIAPSENITLEQWLHSYIGSGDEKDGAITVLDLSLVPSNVVHIVTAVIARMVFELVQRYRRTHNGRTLPTVLVLEEAHSFIKRSSEHTDEGAIDAADVCREVFERIAREGRKFGLGLVLSSQRPSELSPTVLSQCNTFLLHRIVNDRDQELVSRLIPDNLGGFLQELPSLPTGEAILMGWAAPIPVQVSITRLKDEHRPLSDDPKFWEVWVGEEARELKWEQIARDWTAQLE
ncbi:hypothetical protein SD51_13305 [Alicyclobacillus tengchongensis]|nr:hypothetical protein SD51_13305 [Alicyclobacillus tengchongensis]